MDETPRDSPAVVDAVVLDIDGTLVDTVYEHTVAWARAFQDVGIMLPGHLLHRAVGMGSERLVAHVAGDSVENAVGDQLREIHDAEYERLSVRLRLLPGADRVVGELTRRGHRVVIATSGNQRDTDRSLDLVPDATLAAAVVTGGDVEHGKPSTELIDAALTAVGGHRAAVVGDALWDAQSGSAGGHLAIGLLTGGITEPELREAGAGVVLGSLDDLIDRLDQLMRPASASRN